MSITIATDKISSNSGTVTIDGAISADNLSKVAYSGSWNDITDKPTIGSGSIIDEWHDASEWYRVWSDGFIEQGGVSNVSNGLSTITLKKPFANIHYHVSTTITEDSPNWAVLCTKYPLSSPKTTSSFTLKCSWANERADRIASTDLTWYAAGY